MLSYWLQNDWIMCTVTLNIDEARVRRLNPSLTDMDAITRWVQRLVDRNISFMDDEEESHPLSPIAHTPEEMKAIVKERLHLMESGKATYVDGEEVFAQIRARYGFEENPKSLSKILAER